MKINYILIPLVVFLIAAGGNFLTNRGISSGWYLTIRKPGWAPSEKTIGFIWTVIYALTTWSALLFWNRFPRDTRFLFILIFFIVNGFLNLYWSYLFFYKRNIKIAYALVYALAISVFFLIFMFFTFSHLAAFLLLPYFAWLLVAGLINYKITKLNA